MRNSAFALGQWVVEKVRSSLAFPKGLLSGVG